jgi:hypothetical protein
MLYDAPPMARSAPQFVSLAQAAPPTTAPAKQPSFGLNGVGPCIAFGILLFLVVGGGIFWRLLKLDLREQKARRAATEVASADGGSAGGERSMSVTAALVAVLAVGALAVGAVLLALIMVKR